jgi:hypothetical protein
MGEKAKNGLNENSCGRKKNAQTERGEGGVSLCMFMYAVQRKLSRVGAD